MIFTYESKSTKPIANNNFFIELGVNWKQTSLNLNEGWLICLLLSVRILLCSTWAYSSRKITLFSITFGTSSLF